MLKVSLFLTLSMTFILSTAGVALGGAVPGNFAEVIPGKIYRGAQPNLENLISLAFDYKIKTVLDLRVGNVENEENQVTALKMNFVRAAMPAWLPQMLGEKPDEATVMKALSVINDPSLQPVFV